MDGGSWSAGDGCFGLARTPRTARRLGHRLERLIGRQLSSCSAVTEPMPLTELSSAATSATISATTATQPRPCRSELWAIHLSGPDENRPLDAVVMAARRTKILRLVRLTEYP